MHLLFGNRVKLLFTGFSFVDKSLIEDTLVDKIVLGDLHEHLLGLIPCEHAFAFWRKFTPELLNVVINDRLLLRSQLDIVVIWLLETTDLLLGITSSSRFATLLSPRRLLSCLLC